MRRLTVLLVAALGLTACEEASTAQERKKIEATVDFVAQGRGERFERLKAFLTGDRPPVSYAELAPMLETTEAALRMAVTRMRQRYAELLREEIAHTVSRAEDVEDELRSLMAALS